MPEYLYEGLTVNIRENGDAVEYGVEVEDRFFSFAAGKGPDFKAYVQEAQAAKQQSESDQQG
jgi:hypothetical protein